MKSIARTFAAVLAGGALAAAAFAASPVQQEIATALQHAEFSEQASQLSAIQLHLHHVVNCLVGEHGKQFYAAAGDPCKGMGNGAINDAGSDTALKGKLEKILAEAERGLSEGDTKTAHMTALNVKKMLQELVPGSK